MSGEQPLHGVRVLELTSGVMGAYAGKLLADYGAEVIKIEPPGGDPVRRHVVVPGDEPSLERGPLHLHVNTNKRSVHAADPGELAALVERLVPTVDLVLESGSPGEADIDRWETLRPGLVTVSITPFGQDGPYAAWLGEDIVTYAISGPMSTTGITEREPLKLGGLLTSYQVGNMAALAALAGLAQAEGSGQAIRIDVAAIEVQAASIDRRAAYLLFYAYTGQNARREPSVVSAAMPRGVFPTADGYVHVSANPAWRHRMGAALGDLELARRLEDPGWLSDEGLADLLESVLYPWLLDRSKNEAAADAQAERWPVMPLNHPVELLDDRHFVERGFFTTVDHPVAGPGRQPGPPIRMTDGWQLRRPAPLLDEHRAEVLAEADALVAQGSRAPGSPAASSARGGRLPLEGLVVADLTVVWAGPSATMFLADLGAEVVRFDNPWIFPASSKGQLARPPASLTPQMGPLGGGYPNFIPGRRPWNQHVIYAAHARNKKAVTLDLRRDLGRETFLRLIERADVMVENNGVDLVDSLGIGWDAVHARNPRLIMVRMPAMGLTGPYRNWVGFGVNFEALCALGIIRGYTDRDPTSLSLTYHMDAASGTAAAFAVLAALRRRARTGQGELVEVPQSENMINHIGEYIVDADRTGRSHGPLGNRHPTRAPQGCYPCAGVDRWAAISVGSDGQWEALRNAMGDPEWAADGRFATVEGRRAHHDELDRLLAGWTANLQAREVMRRCQLAGVPAAPVNDEAGCFGDPHLLARGFFRPNGSADVGRYPFPGHPWRWNGPPLRWGPLARMGADNDDVYRRLVGLDDAGLEALRAGGHLSEDYLGPDGRPL